MGIHPLFGHKDARERLGAALRAGRLPQVLLVTGSEGVGKQRFALWVAQLLLCDQPAEGEPCGRCRACHQVLGIVHPDLHWFVPIPRPKAGEADRQVDEAEQSLIDALALRREQPFHPVADGMAFHPLASVRLLLRKAALKPVLEPGIGGGSGRRVFVLGEADRLVPQEASQEAANALLKFLEEPPANTWVVLTTTEAERVLPTIRSRSVGVRLSPVSDHEVRAFLIEVVQPEAGETEALIRLAQGAPGRLAGAAGEAAGKGGEVAAKAVTEARDLLSAVRSGGESAKYERALRQPPWSARGGFTDLLDALAIELITEARTAPSLERTEALLTALARVETAREQAQGNVNPQLLLADLAAELAVAR